MALEIMLAIFIILGLALAASLIVFLFFVEVSLVPQMYKKMIPYWFMAGISSMFHVFSHIVDIIVGSRTLYVFLNSLAASVLLLILFFMAKDVFKAVVLVETGKKLEEEVEAKTKEIKRARDYLQAIMDDSPDLIFTVKKDGTFEYANKKLKEVLGYDFEDIRGRDFMEFIPQEMHSFMQKKWEEIQKGIGGTYEARVIRKDGSIIDCFVSHSALSGYDEFLVFLYDITEKKKSEKEIKKYIQELELFHRIGKERELKMIELKSEIARLEKSIKEMEKERTAGSK